MLGFDRWFLRRSRSFRAYSGSWSSAMKGCSRWRCDDDFGARVVGDRRGAADDDVRTFPGPLGGVERYFLSHPSLLVGRRPINGPVGQVSPGLIWRAVRPPA